MDNTGSLNWATKQNKPTKNLFGNQKIKEKSNSLNG
jgi:hypothetical protein